MSELTPSQALLLFGLLARHGECKQAELVPAVKKADRDALVKARLVHAAKEGRGLFLRLEDAGWAWAGENLGAELPQAFRTLHDMLMRLGEHLSTSDETLAAFIGSKPADAVGKDQVKPIRPKSPNPRSKTVPPSRKVLAQPPAPISPQDSIVQAYKEITGGRTGEDVPFSALRAKLPGMARSTFDAALTELHLDGVKARLLRIEDNRSLSDADRQAAFHFKGNVFHVLWIEP